MNLPTTDPLPLFLSPLSLPQIHQDFWSLLENAVHDRHSGWRLPSLGTTDGSSCRQRTLVLRNVRKEQRTVAFHTHRLSAKVAALQRNAEASLLFYDSSRQVQLQLLGTASVHTDDQTADDLWNHEPESSLRGYLAPLIPGTVCATPNVNLPEFIRRRLPNRQELVAARPNFAAIVCQIRSAEVLLLRNDGNFRAVFTYHSELHPPSENWLAP